MIIFSFDDLFFVFWGFIDFFFVFSINKILIIVQIKNLFVLFKNIPLFFLHLLIFLNLLNK